MHGPINIRIYNVFEKFSAVVAVSNVPYKVNTTSVVVVVLQYNNNNQAREGMQNQHKTQQV